MWAIAGSLATLSLILIAGHNGIGERPRDARTEHARPRAGRRGHRRHGVVPAHSRRASRSGSSRRSVQLQLPRPTRPHRLLALPRRARRGVLPEPQRRRRRHRLSRSLPKVRPIPERLRTSGGYATARRRHARRARASPRSLLPLVVTQPSRHLALRDDPRLRVVRAVAHVLTGWAGQLSLGQMAFAGSARARCRAASRHHARIGWHKTPSVGPCRSLSSIVIADVLAAGLAALIGIGALRVRGLLLAVSTFAFGVAASSTSTTDRSSPATTRRRCRSARGRCSGSTCRRNAPTTTSCSPCSSSR